MFAVESQIDIIADELGIDPIELRLKNLVRTGDVTVVGQEINSCGIRECIEKVANHVGWREKREKKQPGRGIGIACAMYHSDNRLDGQLRGGKKPIEFGGSTAYIKILGDGKIRIISGELEFGSGAHTILSQIAAEELGVPLEDVYFSELDTDVVPFALGQYGGGRITTTAGHAVRLAALDAKKQLFTAAAKILGVHLEDLEVRNRKILVKGAPERSVPIAKIASYAIHSLGTAIIGKGVYDPPTLSDKRTLYGNYSTGYTFAAQIAEIEVDSETEQVKVLNFVSAIDVGKAINPMAVEGQSEGGIIQGIGSALTEEIKYEKGRIINPRFLDYKIFNAVDAPPIKTFIVETNDPNCPYGAKGCGQLVIKPTAPAVANAIFNAVGVRFKDLPITGTKIVQFRQGKK